MENGHYILKSGDIHFSLEDSNDINPTQHHSSKSTKISNHLLSTLGFTQNELKFYSMTTIFISTIGFLIHSLVLIILIYQQTKRVILKNRNKKLIKKNFSKIFGRSSSSTSLSFTSNSLTNSQKFEIYNNYVTYAFVFHQSLVDLARIFYAFLFANRLIIERQHNNEIFTIKNNSLSYKLDDFYTNYCTHMASFYSVLSMVTIVNILTILISETCRFYDLKFNSSDTSNYCCVLFGILLIWTSSLIIISSLMLVGVADSASPTWQCDLGEVESTTRSLVINIVWFFLVSFVILIAFSYSISLYKELNNLDREDNRMCLYTINASLLALKSDFIERQIKISKLTLKRLKILIYLLVLFCACFMPNFVTVILKNVLDEKNLELLKPFNLISSILNLANSSLNSIILLILCFKSNDTYLINVNRRISKRKKSLANLLNKMFLSKRNGKETMIDEAEVPLNRPKSISNGIILNTDDNSCILNCNDECIQLRSLSTMKNSKKLILNAKNDNYEDRSRRSSNNTNVIVKEFYSKIGNRLGNSS
ncbi:unnamed protein product [Brachionus calyciflorus]|uniref:G-protein coupled receptors family 1 profile domain-containing protein n=1 Tax=Brachionus calyciflorus TaxID=104777 RepID=A0A813XQT0_9BILA|nr:unnamed protein product [Brachionus calyciflorus]